MRRALTRLATRLLLLAFTGACASAASRAGHGTAEGVVRPDSVVVRVANHSDRALTISLARGGTASRLGDVSAGGAARFALRAADVARAQLTLVATASHESMRTVPFKVRGGQVVWFEIVPGLVGSRLYVRWPEEGPPAPARDR